MKTDIVRAKIQFINEGYKVLSTKYRANGDVKVSFSLAKPNMVKWRKLKNLYGDGPSALEGLVETFMTTPRLPRQNGKTLSHSEFIAMAKKQDYVEYSHKDYLFDSAFISREHFDKIQQIKDLYGISYSAVVRLMVQGAF